MKKGLRYLYWVLTVLPLAATSLLMNVLPDKIPAHYNALGQVTRWGGKWETLILPLCILGIGLLMEGMAHLASLQERLSKNDARLLRIIGLGLLAVLNVECGYFLYTAMQGVTDLTTLSLDLSQLLMVLLGVILIAVGNYMPKTRRGSLVGLRTRASMQSDAVWKKCQHFGGVSLMLSGVAVLVCSGVLKGELCALASVVAILLPLPVNLWYASKTARAERKANGGV